MTLTISNIRHYEYVPDEAQVEPVEYDLDKVIREGREAKAEAEDIIYTAYADYLGIRGPKS